MACPQGCGRAAHGADALACDVGSVGLAEHLAADLEHRVAADDEDGLADGKLGSLAGGAQGLADVCALGRRKRCDFVGRGGCAAAKGSPSGQRGEDCVLINR